MRKMLFLAVLLITAAASYGQQTAPTPPLTKDDYLRKSKGQTAGALLLTAAGAGLFYGAFAYDVNHMFDGSAQNTTGYYVAALGCVGGSILLFSRAARNKRQARTATITPTLKMDNAPLPAATGLSVCSYPSLALSVPL